MMKKPTHRGSKKRNQTNHARVRFKERFGSNFTRRMCRDMILKIESNKATLLSRESASVSIWRVPYQEQEYRVVYDSSTRNIITVLPRKEEESWWFNCFPIPPQHP